MGKYNKYVWLIIATLYLWVLVACNTEYPTVSTSMIIPISSTKAEGGGTIVSEGSTPVFERGICWSQDAIPTIIDEKIIEGSGIGEFVCQISNLMPQTTYYVRAWGMNDSGVAYGNVVNFTTASNFTENSNQIIADHTIVERYKDIPQEYIDKVKTMLVEISGQSHAAGYRNGLNLLEMIDLRFQVITYYITIPEPSDQYLRLGSRAPIGESIYTSQGGINSVNANITSQFNAGNPYSVVGFGWCYIMMENNPPGGGLDPVYKVHWAGSSDGGSEGNLRWGLDAEDYDLTGNTVCMDSYLDAVEQWNDYCEGRGYNTVAIFTTGPIDAFLGQYIGEVAYQREIKHDYIRSYVAQDSTRILFDYADILCWNDKGERYTETWVDNGTLRSYAQIHPDNLKNYDSSWNIVVSDPFGESDHIGDVGALRLGKAIWWLLARIAGWNGE